MKNLLKKILLCLCLFSLGSSVNITNAQNSPRILYRIVFDVVEMQPVTTLIIEEHHHSEFKTTLATVNLPCDVVGDVSFDSEKAVFAGGYLVCTHNEIASYIEGIETLPDDVDVNGIYFDAQADIAFNGQSTYPLMRYDTMQFGVNTTNSEIGQTRLTIGEARYQSDPYWYQDMHRFDVYQHCSSICEFAFGLSNQSEAAVKAGHREAEDAYVLNMGEKVFYIGYDPDNPDEAFHGTIDYLEWDPSLCRCLG